MKRYKTGAYSDPTYADAILDRIVHNAHRINLTGHSLRRSRATKASKDWTAPSPNAKNCQPERHRTPGDIMSEHRATSSRNARATSSESAPLGIARPSPAQVSQTPPVAPLQDSWALRVPNDTGLDFETR
jgi:hypothetical protein